MLKARIWIFDDEDPNVNEVYENFDMKPTEEWTSGTPFGEITNYNFLFTFSKFEHNGKYTKIVKS